MAKKTSPQRVAPEPERSNDLPTRKLLDTVKAWKRLSKGGKPPSTRALAVVLNVSQSGVQWRLRECEAKGLLVRPIVQAPGPLQLSDEGERWIAMAV